MRWTDHLLIVPVVLPMVAAATMLLFDERRRYLKAAINIGSILVLAAVAAMLLARGSAPAADAAAQVQVYRLGNWPAPFGIVLVADRLSAIMLALTALLALAAAAFSVARWHQAGAHFHSLFQFLLMGLNGAFLTGDLFNLFVFFELLLAASYGLALHGSGILRVKAGLQYIVVNLATSMLFLIGVSLIYGMTGTLNMADLAVRIPQVSADNRMLLEAGAALLGIAFLVKAGLWPLSFWLPTTYAAAAPPVAAMFAIMSKVGVYVVLRLWLLMFGDDAGASAHFGGAWIMYGGMATVVFGVIGALASQDMARLAGFSVLVSSGTVMAAIAAGNVDVTGAALFYLINSTLAIAAFFLLIELIERGRDPGADMLAVTREAFGEDEDDTPADEVGIAIPATMAMLGICFIGCALALSGLPPLAGFVAKFAMLAALFNLSDTGVAPVAWGMLALLIGAGMMTLIAVTRAGIRTLWTPEDRTAPRVRVVELTPIAVLLFASLALTVQAGPVMRYLQAAAGAVHTPHDYIRSVLAPAAGQKGGAP